MKSSSSPHRVFESVCEFVRALYLALSLRKRSQSPDEKAEITAAFNPVWVQTAKKGDCSISARLQFHLPDGSLLTNSFPPDTPLETIQQYIIPQLEPSTSSITMYTTYLGQELTEEDLVKTLAELGLALSFTLIVAVKGSNSLTPSGTSSFPELLLWIFSPLLTSINFLKAFLFGSVDQSRGTQNPPSQRTNSSTQSQLSNSTVRHRVLGGVSSVKKEGGIHRLHNRDDEYNIWNGNSTQQM